MYLKALHYIVQLDLALRDQGEVAAVACKRIVERIVTNVHVTQPSAVVETFYLYEVISWWPIRQATICPRSTGICLKIILMDANG